jgi:hypothetical protein
MLRRETIFHSIFSIMSNFWILVWRLDGGATTIIARTVLGLVRLNRLVLRRLCRNWESSQRYGPRGLNALARFAWLRFAPARSAPPSSELWSDDKGLPRPPRVPGINPLPERLQVVSIGHLGRLPIGCRLPPRSSLRRPIGSAA